MLDALLDGNEAVVLADRGYDYPQVHERLTARGTQDGVARRRYPGQTKGLQALQRFNRGVARLRARGEHAFRVVKWSVRLSQDPLSGIGEERCPTDHTLCPDPPVPAATRVATTAGVVCLETGK